MAKIFGFSRPSNFRLAFRFGLFGFLEFVRAQLPGGAIAKQNIAAWQIERDGQKILIDPFLTGQPAAFFLILLVVYKEGSIIGQTHAIRS